MESFQTFMSVFERCRTERNSEGLVDILKNGPKYFQNITTSDSGNVLSTLFDVEKGLLFFLRDELDRGLTHRNYQTAVIQGFHLVEFIMVQFEKEYEPYISSTKEVCELAIKIRCAHFVKRSAANVFKKLIELFNNFELFLDKTIESFGRRLHVYDEAERSEIYVVMGAIAKYTHENVARFSSTIFKNILEDMKRQYKEHNAVQSARYAQYFEALIDLMENFTPFPSEENNQQYYKEVYQYIKWLSEFDENSKYESGKKSYEEKKITATMNKRSAVELLIRHWTFFSSMIYKDYEIWHKRLEALSVQSGKTAELGWRAMKIFYKAIAQVLKNGDTDEEKKVLLFFRKYFLDYLSRLDLNSNLIQLIIWGYSQMAAPCKKHLTNEEVYEMYSLIARRSISLNTRDDANIEEISSYLESLSEILINLPNVSIDQIKLLSKLGTLLIKRFPEFRIFLQPNAIQSLRKSITNIGYLDQNLQQEYLYDLIYNGIIWTCSHTLFIDAELARTTLKERPICYKNYLPLWQELFNISKYKYETGPQVIKQLFKQLITTCTTLINTLNLNIKTKEDTMYSDIALSQTAKNETDFRIFINMVDLYVEIFENLNFPLLENWLPKLLYEIVRNSYRHQMVSGFYKLTHVILQRSGNYWKSVDPKNHTFEMISKFLLSTLGLICGFYHELQIACVYLILDAPIVFIQNELKRTVPVFKIAFQIGLSDFALAASALDALELWTRELASNYPKELKKLLLEVVPSLEPYLQSKESATELLQDILKTQRKTITHVTLKDETKTLEDFQRRILLFLGSISIEITHDFVYKRSQDTKATWDKKDLLEYTLFFPDLRLYIHFDNILPRVVDLALSSGDRRTRMCACEVLHSLIIVILGKTRDILNKPNPDRFAHLYKILCPAMLKLGSDPDTVVRQLYYPTLIQITHWLSSKLMLKSPSTIYLVDALFDGLTDESNSSLREFSGVCLKEFLAWSIKQSSDRDLEKSPINVYTIVRKISTYALHPSTQKRIAAAIAFNHLYSILREREEILNTYWLEIFYCFVKSSEGCNDSGTETAIGHLEKVLKIKAKLFSTENPRRRKPIEFENANLKGAAIWLLTQCGSLDRSYRQRCMKLLESINLHVENCNSVQKLLSFYLKNHGIEGLNSIILKNLVEEVQVISFESVKPLLRTLDSYNWLIGNKLVDLELLFLNGNPNKHLIFLSANNFMKRFMISQDEEDASLISRELELLKTLTCETIVALFGFTQKILEGMDPTSIQTQIPEFFWSQDLFSLISICILNPQKAGLDTKNLQIIEALPQKMDKLIHVVKSKAPEPILQKLEEELILNVDKYYKTFADIQIVTEIKVSEELKLYVRGLILLNKHQFLDRILKDEFTKTEPILIKEIFDILKHQDENNMVILKPDTIEYLESILELVFTNYKSSLIMLLMNYILDETKLTNQDMTSSQHGEYFLSTFKMPIFRGMLRNVEETMKIIYNLLERKPQKMLMVIEQLVIFTQKHKNNHLKEAESLSNEILKRCSSLKRTVNNLEYREKQFMNIYRIVVRLKQNPIEIANQKQELYFWILRKLQDGIDLEQKSKILDDFLICLTDMKSKTNSELSIVLRTLKNDRAEDISSTNINSLKAIACFQTMLAYMPLTKSVVLFETLINFAAGACDQLCNEKTCSSLKTYFCSINSESVLKSLEVVYQFFMNSGSVTARFDVLQRFLLPAFQFCRTTDIEHFFEKNAKEAYTILIQELNTEVEEDLKRLIVSKIGSYNLFEIMFARIDLQKITSVQSLIAKNVFENPEEKQLMKNVMETTLKERKMKSTNPNVKEITRLLHCAAYNCGIAIISLKEEEKFYSLVFLENRVEGKLIWEKILDCEKQYCLQQTFREYPKQRKKLINIRKRSKERENSSEGNNSYIYKYDLASSTLTENIDAFDFNEATLASKSESNRIEETMSLVFECDDFNEHECMASLCGILVHMVRNDIFVPQEAENVQLPKWMALFIQSMKTEFNNVRLFLLKVICNTQTIFKPYAKLLVGIILNTVNEHLKRNNLNYIITDVLLFLIEWRVPLPDSQKKQAQNLLEHLVNKADGPGSRSVKRYNVDIIKMILELWGENLKLPKAIDKKIVSEPNFAIGLILTFLENKLQDQVVERMDIIEFLQKSFNDWKREEDAVLQNCAALGLVVKNLKEGDETQNERNEAIRVKTNDLFLKIFQKLQSVDKNRMIKCIYTLATGYQTWIANFFEFVRNYIGEVDNVGKAKCLEIFLLRIPSLNVEDVKRELGYLNFSSLLQNKILTCEKLGLQIIDSLVAILNPSDLLPMAELTSPYVKNNSSELRESAYEIFMKIITKYTDVSSIDEDVKKLKEMSKKLLLVGLLDSAESLHEKLINFWTEDVSLPEKLVERLLDLLNQYSPDVEEVFLLYSCLSILRLTRKSTEYDEKMFPEKLEECTFNDYRIVMHWRAKNLGSMAPLFARSLASQISQMFTQSTYSSQNFASNFNMQLLRATVGPSFEPTNLQDATFSNTPPRFDDNDSVFKIPDPAYNKVSRRFLKYGGVLKNEFAQKAVENNLRHDEMVKEEVIRQDSDVKLYRKYRIGDFPDIQIAHSSLLIPLQELAKKDWLICKNLVVTMVCSLLKDMNTKSKSQQLISRIFESMKEILENNRGSSFTLAAVLEITLSYNFTDFEPDLVGRVSKNSGLYSLGALYLEKYLIDEPISEPSRKRKRRESPEQKPNASIYLARLYESMNEVDVVLSIFKGDEFSEKLQEAAFAQAASDWLRAKRAYEEAYEKENGFVKEHCLQESFECLTQLSRWDVLDKKVFDKSEKNFNNVWTDPGKEEWLLPWIFRVYLYKILKGDWMKGRDTDNLRKFLETIDDWMKGDKLPRIKRRFGEETSMLFLMDSDTEKPELARDFLKNSLDDVREDWIRLNPLSEKLRSRLLLKLRGISNIDIYLKSVKSDLPNGINDLMKYWSENLPSPNEDLLPWETHINYRLHFANILSSSPDIAEKEEILQKLQSICIQQKMRLVDFAIEHKNKFIAKNYVVDLEEMIKSNGIKKLEFFISTSRCFYLLGECAEDNRKKLSFFTQSWNHVHRHLKENKFDSSLRISALQHVTSLISVVENLANKGDELARNLISSSDFTSKISTEEIRDIVSFKKLISDYGLTSLKETCEIATQGERADCYFKLVVYCYDRVSKNDDDLQLIREFVSATLKAMSYGSYKAAHYFPCLLKKKYLEDEEAKEIFVSESQRIETWLFIAWQAQILSHLGGSLAEVLIPIIKRLIKDYPNAVMYTFRSTIEANPSLLKNSKIREMKGKLYNKPDVESFLTAMHYISHPELYLIHHFTEAANEVLQGKPIIVENLLKKVFPNDTQLCGPIFNQIVKKITSFKSEIQDMKDKTYVEIKPQIKKITDLLKKSLEERTNNGSIFKTKLKDYSPWLQKLSGSEIEVPGQYLGDRKPLPRYHAKIGKIESTIRVMQSLRKPIKITIVGNDAKNYSFLVKFDEDLRLDQRVQQAFTIMNKILQNDIACGQRHLAIDTYQVIPFSLSLGLIEWVEGTRTLEDYIHFTLTKNQIQQCYEIQEIYEKWIGKTEKRRLAYKDSLLKYDASKVVSKMNELTRLTEWEDSLRKTFFVISPSTESFMSLRHNFVTTYGTMCIAQWILGIGDRHLENTLITVKSGRCLGIDFGLAFGAGVDICVPELMPFRLTPQIQGLLKPFKENGPLGTTMVHVLRALRKEKGPLMACLDVFVHEPLNWTQCINKMSKENQEDITDVNWLPKKRISTVQQKLSGKKPSLITVEELKVVHSDSKYFCRYQDIVNGTEENYKTLRAKIKNENLSSEEQVQCLIDQATDLNILGRTWKGWQPWL